MSSSLDRHCSCRVGPVFQAARDWATEEYNSKLRPHVGDIASSAYNQINELIEKAVKVLQQ